FAVVSAVVAFNGWPGAGSHHGSRNLSVQAGRTVAWDVSGARSVAAAAARAAAVVVARPVGPVISPVLITSPRSGGAPLTLGPRSTPTTRQPPTGQTIGNPTGPPTA